MFPICNDVGEVIAFSGRILTNDAETRQIPQLAGNAALSERQHPLRPAQNEARPDRCELRHRLRGATRSDHAFRSRHDECGRAAGNRLHRRPGAHLETFCQRSRALLRRRCGRQKAAERSFEPLLENNLVVRVAEMPPGEDPDSFVRKEGAEKFEHADRRGPGFFRLLDRTRSGVDRSRTLSAKMQLARQLAETVARVHDPLMRSEVISKVSGATRRRARRISQRFCRKQRATSERPRRGRGPSPGPAPRDRDALPARARATPRRATFS